MNAREAFPGTGMAKGVSDLNPDGPRWPHADVPPPSDDDAFADAVSGALAADLAEAMGDPYHLPITLGAKRELFQHAIENERAEKAAQQAIAAAALAKVKQLTASIRSMEDALDGLLVSEA